MWYLYSEWSIFSVLLLEQRIWTLSLSLTPAENFKKQRTHIAWMLTIPHKSATRTYFIYKYMLCLQDMNQAPTLALKSSLARQIGVKRCHVTDSWPNAEEGISAATQHNTDGETLTWSDSIYPSYLYLSSHQPSNGRICQSSFRHRSRAAALLQRVRHKSATLNQQLSLASSS